MSGDSIDGIADSLERAALLCDYNAEVGFNVHCIRAKNTPIRGTGGLSNGLVPMLKAYNTSIVSVSRSNKSEGTITVYLEPWHADIFEFLELKRSIGCYLSLESLVHISINMKCYGILSNCIRYRRGAVASQRHVLRAVDSRFIHAASLRR